MNRLLPPQGGRLDAAGLRVCTQLGLYDRRCSLAGFAAQREG